MQRIQVLELSVKKKKKEKETKETKMMFNRVRKKEKKRNKRNAIITNEQVQIIERKKKKEMMKQINVYV